MSSAKKAERQISNQDQSADKAKDATVRFKIETITPDVAAKYLNTSKAYKERLENKRFKKGDPETASDINLVKSYSEIMKSGGWIVNGMPIIFGTDGQLIDGVTRLEACVLSGESFRSVVARNVRADTLHTIDQHLRRTYSGVLESRGVNFAGSIQRTMTKLIRIENGILGKDNSKISWSRFDRVLEGNPELMEAISISEGSKGSVLHSTPRPVLSFMALKAGKRDQLRFFLAGLRDTETFPLGSPVRMLANQLRNELRREKSARENDKKFEGMSLDQILAISIMAFNDYCDGKTVEDQYFWDYDYGEAKKNRESRKAVRELAPDNLGLPTIDGYPGLTNGSFDQEDEANDFSGELAESLIRANKEESGDEGIKMRTITPEKAQEYLRLNRDNRPLSDDHKRMIAKDIKDGNWMLNAQPICFTGDPDSKDAFEKGVRLLNGQHRLHGCIEADMTIDVPIAKNITEAAFGTFDSHTKKMRMNNTSEADDRVLVAAARLQWKEDNNIEIFSTGINPTASEILKTIEDHPDMAKGYSRARSLKKLASAGIMTYLIHHVMTDNPDYADDFLEGLRTGEELQSRNPVLTARTKIIGQRSGKTRIPRKEILKTLINSWRDYKTYRQEIEEDSKQEKMI
jgi:hypothetical protein